MQRDSTSENIFEELAAMRNYRIVVYKILLYCFRSLTTDMTTCWGACGMHTLFWTSYLFLKMQIVKNIPGCDTET